MLVQLGLWQSSNDRPIHTQMIGAASARSTLLATIAVLGVAALFGGRASDPLAADPPRAARQASALSAALADADAALASLESQLQHAVDAARGGAALVLEGDAAPDERFDAAALTLETSGSAIAAARQAMHAVARLGSWRVPPLRLPELPIDEAAAARLGAELRATGTKAASVASLRHATAAALRDLEAALAAASDGRADAVVQAVAAGRDSVATAAEWNATLPTLSVWTSGMRGLLDALDGIATALRNGDAAALAAAHDAYAAATLEASRADRGRAIALGDAAASIGGGAPAALVSVLARVGECRAAVASVVLEPVTEDAQ